LHRILPPMGAGFYITVVIIIIVAVLLLARMVLRTPGAGMRLRVFGLLSLAISRNRREEEPPDDDTPPRK
jgi:hypothetical protein